MQKVRILLRKYITLSGKICATTGGDGHVKYQLWTQTHHSAVHPQSPGGQLKNTWQPGKRKCPFSCARTNAKTKTGKKYLFTWQKTCLLGRRLVYLAEKSIYSGERRRKRRNNQRAAMVFKECKLTVHKSKCCTKRKLILHFILSCSNFFSFQPSGWPPLHWLLKRNVNCLIL